MKQIIKLSNEYILDVRFSANQKRVEGQPNAIDWVDSDSKIANGKDFVEGVEMLLRNRDEYGYNGKADLIYLYRKDILELAEKIKEIESIEKTGIPSDDLPF
jgi:hypothetical protein